MNRRNFHKSSSPMYCMSQKEEDLLDELVKSKDINRCVEICNSFEDRIDILQIAEEILCAKLKCILKQDLTIRQLVRLFAITPTVGGSVRDEILKKIAERKDKEPLSEIQKLAKNAPHGCKAVLLSFQGESVR